MTSRLHNLIEELINSAYKKILINQRNIVYIRNQVYANLKIQPDSNFIKNYIGDTNRNLYEISCEILTLLPTEITEYLGETIEIQTTRIINWLLPLPDEVEDNFYTLKNITNSKHALDWYYQFGIESDYIKAQALAQNISWNSNTKYGDLTITINLSKPEKDPAEIAKAKMLEQSQVGNKYPLCQLCAENEGFSGNFSHPSRFNHRMIQIELSNQSWFLQFSPYAYYNQHAIVLNKQHRDMRIDTETFNNFFEFVDFAPHYIIGSNSDIPIVGGSILTHDHYQTGEYIFPIEKAQILFSEKSRLCPAVDINYLNWPLSTIQLIGDRTSLTILIGQIIEKWYTYNFSQQEIIAKSTNGTRHNGVTPIMRKS